MEPPLTAEEVRVLGSLVEKQITTPDNYPLSMSALVAACNQTSNRDPVMRLDEDAVMRAIVPLRRRGLMRAIQPSGSRVTKYEVLLRDALNLDARELAVLAVLMLRGAQTPGELNARTARLAEFADLADVETTLATLAARQPEPLVVRLPRSSGRREDRYAHLLSGEAAAAASPESTPNDSSASADDRVAALERTVDELRADLAALREELREFRAQFQ